MDIPLKINYPAYFLIFSATNALLSYTSFQIETKLWIGLIGFAVPFFFGLLTTLRKSSESVDFCSKEWMTSIPGWAWVVIIVLALPMRFYCLFNSNWLVSDEGVFGFLSLELSRKWNWHLVYSAHGQIPPLFNWLLALYFKLVTPTILSMRFFIFTLSLLSLISFYLTANLFFRKTLSFLCFSLFCFGFWPLFTFKFVYYFSAALLFQILAFWALGSCLRSNPASIGFALLLSILLGLGLWVSISWPLLLLMVIVPFVLKRKAFFLEHGFWVSLSPLGLFLGVFLACLFFENNLQHIRWLLVNESTTNVYGRLPSLFSNWTTLFWEGHPHNSLGPSWGGILNPLEGAACLLGILELIKYRKNRFSQWLMAAAMVFAIPGLLTNNYESFHNHLLLPVLIGVCALGIQAVLLELPKPFRWILLLIFFLFSASLNAFHILQSDNPAVYSEDVCQRAYRILNHHAKTFGPGLVFQDMDLNMDDQTLTLASYHWNAAQNQKLDPFRVHWSAVIVNSNYKYFLSRRFPDIQWYSLGPDAVWNLGGLLLAIIPQTRSNEGDMREWNLFNLKLHGVTTRFFFDHSASQTKSIFSQLLELEDQAGKDPFLESIFCEKVIFYLRNSENPLNLLPWIQKAVQKGYPAPHLLVAEGLLLQALGNHSQAKAAFQKAVQCPLNDTRAKDLLAALSR